MVECPDILSTEIEAQVLDTPLGDYLLRQCIADSQVLQTQVGGVLQILGLIHTQLAVSLGGVCLHTREVSVRIILRPVVHVLHRHIGPRLCIDTPEIEVARSRIPVTLAYALKESTQVEPFPRRVDIEAVRQTDTAVADFLAVTRIVQRSVAPSNLAVTVQVLITGITDIEAVRLVVLAHFRLVQRVQFCLASKTSVVDKSPDFTDFHAHIIIVYPGSLAYLVSVVIIKIHIIVELRDERTAVGYIELHAVTERRPTQIELVAPFHRHFPTACLHVGRIRQRSRGTYYGRQFLAGCHHICRNTLVNVERSGQPVVQESQINAEVACAHIFPGKSR